VAGSGPASAAEPPAPVETGHIVRSPMVGTFYRASSPGAKPLVEIGAAVKEGDPVCIIEAMKIMNEIDADRGGVNRPLRLDDANLAVRLGDLKFRDVRLGDQVDQRLQFSQVHRQLQTGLGRRRSCSLNLLSSAI
jgi:hypothetical protein